MSNDKFMASTVKEPVGDESLKCRRLHPMKLTNSLIKIFLRTKVFSTLQLYDYLLQVILPPFYFVGSEYNLLEKQFYNNVSKETKCVDTY